ncbi:MAG: type IV pilin N-terminal domain-containing protein [Thermoplasmatales archaeon]|nr:type IV pilin N-terminal domain-containing protein [Thermoplasmatales archaeon]
MWKIKNKEAVSPVIGVILMVAITVVLAAVLYVWVAGMGTGVKTTPTGYFDTPSVAGNETLITDTYPQYVNVSLISISTPIAEGSVKLILVGVAGSAPQVLTSTMAIGAGVTFTYQDYNGDSKLSAGDRIDLKSGTTGQNLRGLKVRLELTDTSGTIAEITIPAL